MPLLRLRGNSNPAYALDTAAGRFMLLAVFSSDDETRTVEVERWIHERGALFDDERLCFFGIRCGRDGASGALADRLPGVRWLFDDEGVFEPLLGGVSQAWIVVDPAFRVMAVTALDNTDEIQSILSNLPPANVYGGFQSHAPVLILPRVFEPSLCQRLIDFFDDTGGETSGFMREIDGRTTLVHDERHKRRHDRLLPDGPLKTLVRERLARQLAPQIEKVFQFRATRVERYLVAAYDGASGGWFRPHRDNTTLGTAHRRFAVSINLNSDFDGGDLRFPEFGSTVHRPPPGGVCVFSCSLLHEATPVTRGRRYAFLPFLYDETAAQVRAANLRFVDGGPST